ncbi:MAG: hypothetical protein JOZ47_16500 [Kutzneria sp.]|nr:hypothetical protein [Kutzneria sp.]
MTYVVGVDAGGSHTRAVVVGPGNGIVATGQAGGANPVAHGVDTAIARLESALRDATATLRPELVTHCVIGLAGGATGGAPVRRAVSELAGRLGFDGGCTLVSDVEVAFAAGTESADGVLLLAGTGAVAAELKDHREIRHVDGDGWLLGDDGSGFWLGRQAVRAALAQLDGRGAPTALLGTVAEALDAEPSTHALRTAAYRRPPVTLAGLAPLVDNAAREGDTVATAIVDNAAELLVASVAALDPVAGGHREAVLAGGALLADGPLTNLVTARLRGRFGLRTRLAGDGALGAAALAGLFSRR